MTQHGNEIHGHSSSGGKRPASPTYRSWRSMLTRCNWAKHAYYDRYGGRGIQCAERWTSFENFLEDMGVRPEGMTLERLDNDKGYSKANCTWATRKEQANNRRNSRMIKYKGETKTLTEWSSEVGINRRTLSDRILKRGWSVEDAFSTPVSLNNRWIRSGFYENKEK